jgi:long-chain fatty acid transport protein
MNHLHTRVSAAALIAAAAIGPGTAGASGFALLEQSASRLGTAFAGTGAAADDATTLFFNPAGMMKLEGNQLAAGLASGIEITSEFSNAGSTAAFGQPLGATGGDAGGWNFVPGAYLTTPLTDDLTIGLGINAPFGLKLVYEAGWVGRFQALHSEIQTINVNPSIAWQVNDRFSIGAGISYQHLQAELTNAVNYSAVVAQGVQQLVALGQLPAAAAPAVIAANVGLGGAARVRGDDVGWGFNIGILFDASDATRIGLAYRSAVEYDVGGTINFTQPATIPSVIGAGIVTAASATGAPLSPGPVSVDLKVPDSAILSLRQSVSPKLALLADVAWTGWSSVQELRVVRDSGVTVSVTPERWRDVMRYALGATYELNERVTLRTGVAYDNTPVPDATRTPRLPDTDRTWAAIGGRWQPSQALALDVAYAHLFSKTVPLSQNAGSTAASALLLGEQHSDIDILSAQLTYRFK